VKQSIVTRFLDMWSRIVEWRSEHRRNLDLQFLWPAIRESALNMGLEIESARAAFAVHAFNDAAWLVLGQSEIELIVAGLE
jgi:hypothetical protein